MKHTGRARRAALRLILMSLALVCVAGFLAFGLGLVGAVAKFPSGILVILFVVLGAIWLLFTLFTLYFFRDPNPEPPREPGVAVCPGHGKIDAVEQIDNSEFPGGRCHRISIFLSVIDIHVQNAPISGKVVSVKHTPGKFISALEADSAVHNENVLIGFESAETIGEKIGVRLIAGVLARRIIPFVQPGDELNRGDRISLIQFGSRCDLYLPLSYKIKVKVGDRGIGGKTVMASKI